jgi:DNA-directed RNA polymerase specialized sigma24 family protein
LEERKLNWPKTRTGFLDSLGQSDNEAWIRFEREYGGIILGLLAGFVPRDQLDDAMQEFHRVILIRIRKDPTDIQKFRAWLLVVVNNFSRRWYAKRDFHQLGAGGTTAQEKLCHHPAEQESAIECKTDAMNSALERAQVHLKAREWQILGQYLAGEKYEDIAATHKISAARVSQIIRGRIAPILTKEYSHDC